MSVQNLKAPDAFTRATFAGMPARCFFCGEDIADVAVVWSGDMGDDAARNFISLHPACATRLGGELIASISVPSFPENFDENNDTMTNAEISAEIQRAVERLSSF